MITPLFLLEEVLNQSHIINPVYNTTSSKSKYYLKREKDSLVFRTAAVGIKEEDVSMSIDNKHLVIKSKTKKDNFFNTTIDYNVYVGDDIKREKTTASLQDGILTVKMPVVDTKKSYEISF